MKLIYCLSIFSAALAQQCRPLNTTTVSTGLTSTTTSTTTSTSSSTTSSTPVTTSTSSTTNTAFTFDPTSTTTSTTGSSATVSTTVTTSTASSQSTTTSIVTSATTSTNTAASTTDSTTASATTTALGTSTTSTTTTTTTALTSMTTTTGSTTTSPTTTTATSSTTSSSSSSSSTSPLPTPTYGFTTASENAANGQILFSVGNYNNNLFVNTNGIVDPSYYTDFQIQPLTGYLFVNKGLVAARVLNGDELDPAPLKLRSLETLGTQYKPLKCDASKEFLSCDLGDYKNGDGDAYQYFSLGEETNGIYSIDIGTSDVMVDFESGTDLRVDFTPNLESSG